MDDQLDNRAAVFAALGEPIRLALVDKLILGDLSPGELAAQLGVGTNLLAHHLKVLEDAGVVRRSRSEGDRRRSYVQLCLDNDTVRAATGRPLPAQAFHGPIHRILFVCTANSARSQLAAATWNSMSTIPAASAGTHPARKVHPKAVTVARRHGLGLDGAVPATLADVRRGDELIVAVCDNAHEELGPDLRRLHWSVPDPVRQGSQRSFEAVYTQIDHRVRRLSEIHTEAHKAS